MAYDVAKIIRTAKRLQEATGYLELGMTQHALDSLEGLEAGPLEAEVTTLRHMAQRLQHGHHDTAVSLQETTEQEPTNKTEWLTLSLCYHLAGDVQHAIQALARARGAHPPHPK